MEREGGRERHYVCVCVCVISPKYDPANHGTLVSDSFKKKFYHIFIYIYIFFLGFWWK